MSLCNFLKVILNTEDCIKYLMREEISKKALDKIFIFCLAWGLGASLT